MTLLLRCVPNCRRAGDLERRTFRLERTDTPNSRQGLDRVRYRVTKRPLQPARRSFLRNHPAGGITWNGELASEISPSIVTILGYQECCKHDSGLWLQQERQSAK